MKAHLPRQCVVREPGSMQVYFEDILYREHAVLRREIFTESITSLNGEGEVC